MRQNIKKHNSSIELLRIIAMFMIVIHHYSVHGIFNYDNEFLGLNRYILSIVKFGEWAVDIFIIISGYFGVNSKFNIKRIVRLYVSVWFYSVTFFIIYTFVIREFHSGIAIRSFLPILGEQYWFFSKYIVLCILAPFLNKMIESISRQMHLRLILLLVVLWGLMPNILPEFIGYNLTIRNMSLEAFVLLYIIGAYLRLYPDCKMCKPKNSCIILISSIAIMLVYEYFKVFSNIEIMKIDCFSNGSIISIGFATAAFCIFNRIDLKSSKIINEISQCTFAIYLIHDNECVKEFLWNDFVKGYEYQNSPYMISHMIGCSVAIFVICLIIELIRRKTIDKLWVKFEEKYLVGLYEKMISN